MMSRKPIHLEAMAKYPKGRQVIWEAIRASAQRFDLRSIMDETDINRDTVRSYLRGLEAAGIVERLEAPPDHVTPQAYRLVSDCGVDAPRVGRQGQPVTQGLAQEQMWRTMRLIGQFNARELAAAATTEDITVSSEAAKDYCFHLAKAGYLETIDAGRPGRGGHVTRWFFVPARYTGPKPPMIQRRASIWDPNLRQIVWQEAVRED